MPELLVINVLFSAACLIMAPAVWLFVRKELKTGPHGSGSNADGYGAERERRRMRLGDGINAAINALIGMLLKRSKPLWCLNRRCG